MLRTLFVQEIRTQAPRNAAVLGVCAVIMLGFLALWWLLADAGVLAALAQVAAFVTLVAAPAVVMGQVGVEYWQSMYGQRGYLTMVVPVRGRVHLAAKTSYAVLVALVLVALSVLGLLAWATVLAHTAGTTLGALVEPMLSGIEAFGTGKALVFLGATVMGMICLIIEVAAVMSIGAQGRFNHLGFGAPLVGFVLLYVASQVLGLVFTLFVPLSVDVTTGDLVGRLMWPDFLEATRTGAEPTVVGIGSIVVGPLLAAGLAWWAVRAVERHTCLR
ncbi:hypothetical protein [Actinomyces howellii]|uniref:ABC-2 family transporter protein n=1 Tax=Actinomyces howellii TaxID=52771 RepID=A0A448HK11_9ACTO|nr:hypothetical protein [Actinomyces howellii]VEG30074.1 Uncharacterised protein [Actinomyces howellii]